MAWGTTLGTRTKTAATAFDQQEKASCLSSRTAWKSMREPWPQSLPFLPLSDSRVICGSVVRR